MEFEDNYSVIIYPETKIMYADITTIRQKFKENPHIQDQLISCLFPHISTLKYHFLKIHTEVLIDIL